MRRLTIVVVIAAMAFGLSACGRKGKLIPPEGSAYPRNYPDIDFPQGPKGTEVPQPAPAPAPADRSGLEGQY